ncbi:efflux RND transporter periplasmic adaptor subunit [Oscillatoria sp. CS-180]|uniref:efflux RND transporter periplasmic adaptor subunit n=1 Tax=Oscillatoria sp. CS-180 TaxID=3021720 RepID=UPI00232DBFF8|nr:efflux RND transporter periplasmic adaptor subunit [Oscillatoria sp. CS-180]MDB9525163.1 efflux RND transporter periplasmic adaptor subunit [Oscillatoria sp. CS-180]
MQIPLFGKVRRPFIWLLGFMAVGIVGLGAISFVVSRTRGTPYDVEALTVPVEATALTVRITASGTVEPIQTVNLSPETSGILEELYVEQGDRVTEGQLIAQMESDDIETQIRLREAAVAETEAQLADVIRGADREEIAQAEAAVQAANAQVEDLEARLDLAIAELDRNRQLEAAGAISDNELDNFVQAVRSAEASLESARFQAEETEQRLADLQDGARPEEIAQAEARLAQAQAQLESTRVQLGDTRIRAPFSGIVTQKFANEGAVVTPTTSASDATSATSTAIVAIASELEIVADVPEADIARIRPGQAVEIVADAFPDEVFEGTVRLIAPEAIERQNVTLFQVRVELLSGQDVLRSNMNVTVAFIGDQLSDALVVPTVAIVTQEGQSGVLVPGERDRIRFKPVTLGSQAGNQIQILEGVEEGDLVFVDLPPGQTLDNLTFGRDSATDTE